MIDHEVRISRDELYLGVCDLLAARSTCLRGHVGALVVVENRIVSTGYNGSPSGAPHCLEAGCLPVPGHRLTTDELALDAWGCQRSIHAELNTILWAARYGIKLDGGHMYCTYSPCKTCAEAIVQAGIKSFTNLKPYRAERLDILKAAGIAINPICQ
jgi:dCMP deaminase